MFTDDHNAHLDDIRTYKLYTPIIRTHSKSQYLINNKHSDATNFNKINDKKLNKLRILKFKTILQFQ